MTAGGDGDCDGEAGGHASDVAEGDGGFEVGDTVSDGPLVVARPDGAGYAEQPITNARRLAHAIALTVAPQPSAAVGLPHDV